MAEPMSVLESTRDAYGDTLVELGRENPNIVVLDADLSASTKTDKFARAFPDRFFNMGIAEANMMGVAAGLASAGKIAFASTFAVFATGRVYDQIRQSIAYPRFNVKIVASHGGLTVGPDGASHQSLEDIALMRAIPGMVVIVPCDAQETREAVRAAASYDGPVYIRLGREPVPRVLPEGTRFTMGKALLVYPELGQRGSSDQVFAEKKFDVAFVACGVMVKTCIEAAKLLQAEGISCAVADFASVKPLDEALLIWLARSSRAIITAEEHSVIGGLGSAVCEFLSETYPVPVYRVGVRDQFGQSGSAHELLAAYGLDVPGVVRAARQALMGHANLR